MKINILSFNFINTSFQYMETISATFGFYLWFSITIYNQLQFISFTPHLLLLVMQKAPPARRQTISGLGSDFSDGASDDRRCVSGCIH